MVENGLMKWWSGGEMVERWWRGGGEFIGLLQLSNTALDGRAVSVGSVGTNHLMATNDYSRVDMKMWLVAGADSVVVESST